MTSRILNVHMTIKRKYRGHVACKNTFPHKIKNTGYKIYSRCIYKIIDL